jgi:hypothetical protein
MRTIVKVVAVWPDNVTLAMPQQTSSYIFIYLLQSRGPEGLAWAFSIPSQAQGAGLTTALAWPGRAF